MIKLLEIDDLHANAASSQNKNVCFVVKSQKQLKDKAFNISECVK